MIGAADTWRKVKKDATNELSLKKFWYLLAGLLDRKCRTLKSQSIVVSNVSLLFAEPDLPREALINANRPVCFWQGKEVAGFS
jgi:hypothetical protein